MRDDIDQHTQAATRLARRLQPVRDARMRSVLMAETLLAMSEDEAIQVLVVLVRKARGGADPGFALALETLVLWLGDRELLPYRARASLYAAAKELGHHEIGRLFFDASPNQDASSEGAQAASSPEWKPTPGGRALTLGERKSLARAPRREALRLVMRDPHPEVIRMLLGNPTLTESDVVQIAARRPVDPATLEAIARHPRWGARYAVKRALIKNPYTAVALALRLLTVMRQPDLRAVAHDQQLDATLREQAETLLDD